MDVDRRFVVLLNRGTGVALGERAIRLDVDTDDMVLPLTVLALDKEAFDIVRGLGLGTDDDNEAREVVRDTRVDVSDGVPREAIQPSRGDQAGDLKDFQC